MDGPWRFITALVLFRIISLNFRSEGWCKGSAVPALPLPGHTDHVIGSDDDDNKKSFRGKRVIFL